MTAAALEVELSIPRAGFTVSGRFSVDSPGVVSLFGPSGAGKTTLLRALAGLETQARGRVTVGEQCWQDSDRGLFLPPHRRRVGLVFQEPRLFDHLDAGQNLRFGCRYHPTGPGREKEICRLLDLADLLDRPVQRLSGGERQRVAIGRCLMTGPRLLLLDEPLAGVDPERRRDIEPYLLRLREEMDGVIVHVSHDWSEVLRLADRVLRIEEGRLVEDAATGVAQRARLEAGEGLNLLTARVTGHDAGHQLLSLEVGHHPLRLAGPKRTGHLRLLVNERDVALSLAPVTGTSILNQLPARVARLEPACPGQVRVLLEIEGQPLSARVSSLSVEDLELAPDRTIWVLIKSAAIEGVDPAWTGPEAET